MKNELYEVEVMNCKLPVNSAMKRHQKFMVHASSLEEAQAKVRAENPEIFNDLCAILTTLNEVAFAPESMIYLAIGADLEKWETLKALLCSGGLATSEGHAMRITDKGRAMADKIMMKTA